MRLYERGQSIEELAESARVPVRTIRYYITERLVPGPGARGKAAVYGDEHLLRLKLIRRLVEQHVPLADIRGRMAALSLPEIRSLLRQDEKLSAEQEKAENASSPRDYVSTLLRRARAGRVAEPELETAPYTSGELAPSTPSAPRFQPASAAAQSALVSSAGEPSAGEPSAGEPSAGEPSAPPISPQPWHRFELAPGVELNLRDDVLNEEDGLIQQLTDTARRFRARGTR